MLPVGRHGLLVELDSSAAVESLYEEIRRRQRLGTLPEVTDVVPAARTVLLDGTHDPAGLARLLEDWRPGPWQPAANSPVVTVPTRYDGPDLKAVAAHCGLSVPEVVAAHTGATYRVAFCGFMPGFAYLAGVPAAITVPRHATPHAEVPAGSVGLAGEFTGIYPRSSPGGWQLIGHTDLPMWDPSRQPPALLGPGTRVRFTEADP
jgi:KipI family sensor histidine kinase inhibitor